MGTHVPSYPAPAALWRDPVTMAKEPPAEDVLLDVGTPHAEGGMSAWGQQPGVALHSISIPRLWSSLPISSRALLLLGAASGATAAVFAATTLQVVTEQGWVWMHGGLHIAWQGLV